MAALVRISEVYSLRRHGGVYGAESTFTAYSLGGLSTLSSLKRKSSIFSILLGMKSNSVFAQFCNSLHMAGSLFGKRLSSSNPQMSTSQLQTLSP